VKRKTDVPNQERRVWTDADFEDMSWHDNHVHGLQIRSGDYGAGELDLDLDYIVEWLCAEDGSCEFRLAPATLTFREVSELRIEVDYQAVTAGLVPFSIDGISREPGTVATESLRRWTVTELAARVARVSSERFYAAAAGAVTRQRRTVPRGC
jgi:hypothetical protein